MSEDTGGETIDWSSAIASDRDVALEPEIIRWLKMYVDVADGRAPADLQSLERVARDVAHLDELPTAPIMEQEIALTIRVRRASL